MVSVPNIELFSATASTILSSSSSISMLSEIPEGMSASKVKKIALAIFPGVLAILGSILLGIGTIASLGTLPLALVIGATIITGIASIILGIMANRDKSVRVHQEPNSLPIPIAYEEEVIGELKLMGTILAARNESPFDARDESYLEKTIVRLPLFELDPVSVQVHKRFFKDLFQNRARVSIDGKTFEQMFLKENEKLESLEKIRTSLEEEVNAILPEIDDDLDFLLDQAEQGCETYKSEFSEKVGQEFMNLTYKKLGHCEKLIAPISAALSQYVASDLNHKMMQLSSENFKGTLQPRKDLKSKGPVYSLEFPKDSKIAAKITITDHAEFDEIVDGCKRSKLTLDEKEASIKYAGKATVTVDVNGESIVETFVKLVPSILHPI